jgi:hypothetical protein
LSYFENYIGILYVQINTRWLMQTLSSVLLGIYMNIEQSRIRDLHFKTFGWTANYYAELKIYPMTLRKWYEWYYLSMWRFRRY